ncbi:MAG TPA: molybdenum cofactor biosynthesis protein MoaE [Terriglobia bacterium]|nr:molybdenum cofactor biosynthesis protein MoaE [Terriglobia bacterium]
MKIRVLFFGLAHDVTGFAQEEAELPEGAVLGYLWKQYQERFPRLAELADSLLIAVNEAIAEPSRTLREGDEVAFLPPVSGGEEKEFFQITRSVIPTAALASRLKGPHDGAVVVFEGIVRNHSQGRKTLYLEYEAYEPMAIRMMEEIGREAKQKFAVDHIGMIHRIGRIEIGETSVAIIVTSAHRRAAFEACHYAIDELKRRVPIWKKEYFEDGSAWADGEFPKEILAEAPK